MKPASCDVMGLIRWNVVCIHTDENYAGLEQHESPFEMILVFSLMFTAKYDQRICSMSYVDTITFYFFHFHQYWGNCLSKSVLAILFVLDLESNDMFINKFL